MQLRRCTALWLEPNELAQFRLEDLLAGGTGVATRMRWLAHAPHLAQPVEVEAADLPVLGELGPADWVDAAAVAATHGEARIARLLQAGLLVANGADEADAAYRALRWHDLAAIYHLSARWEGEDSMRDAAGEGRDSSPALRARHGAPPPVQRPSAGGEAGLGLPRVPPDAFEALLDARGTCRNFDEAGNLPLEAFSRLMARVFGARALVHAADDFDVLKKTSPSGGALHPTEAHLVVQRVEGIAPGLYHYRPVEHALQPVPWRGDAAALREFARVAVAGQDYFAGAHVLVALAPRFARNFWKYRNHAKAYRVCILDAGHLSQTLFLSATEQGLGAFITAAINEVDIERAFGLAGCVDGPLAVCGFGLRADRMSRGELDPNHTVWPRT